jgi:hypothetical protein
MIHRGSVDADAAKSSRILRARAGAFGSTEAFDALAIQGRFFARWQWRKRIAQPGHDIGADPPSLQIAWQHVPAAGVKDEPETGMGMRQPGEEPTEGIPRDDLVVLSVEE